MDNPKKLATVGTQDTGQRLEKTEMAIKNGQSKETGNIGYTRHMTKVRENRRGNQEFTIQRNWQHWVHKTQDKD
jgi:3-phenylpropionate/cinnamic acid dioxygenase small subunit